MKFNNDYRVFFQKLAGDCRHFPDGKLVEIIEHKALHPFCGQPVPIFVSLNLDPPTAPYFRFDFVL